MGCVINVTHLSHFPEKKKPVPMIQEAGWAQDRYKTEINFKGIEYDYLNLINVVQNRKQWRKCKLQLPQKAKGSIAFEGMGRH